MDLSIFEEAFALRDEVHKADFGTETLGSINLRRLAESSDIEQLMHPPQEERAVALMERAMELRDQAMLQIDVLLRKFPKQIKPLDMEVVYQIDDDELRRRLQVYGPDLEDVVGAGCHSFAEKRAGPAVTVQVIDRRDTYKACARSWKRRPDVGTDAQFPDLTMRDAAAMRSRGGR